MFVCDKRGASREKYVTPNPTLPHLPLVPKFCPLQLVDSLPWGIALWEEVQLEKEHGRGRRTFRWGPVDMYVGVPSSPGTGSCAPFTASPSKTTYCLWDWRGSNLGCLSNLSWLNHLF